MTDSQRAGGLLRAATPAGHRVTSMELFFDLVYVFAVTQLSHLLLEHLTLHGALQTLLLLVAVWWAWIYTAWLTNWFDPDRRAVRLTLMGVMLASLIMSAALPQAFGERGLLFAAAYATMQIGRCLFAVLALSAQPNLQRNFQRILIWCVAAGVLWLAGGLAQGLTREILWLAAVAVDIAAPAVGFYVLGLGRSRTTDWAIAGAHLAERCQLFIILALGESILVTGTAVGELPLAPQTVAAFVLAFLGSVTLWLIYFDRAAEFGSEIMAHASDPGRLGRSAYTYFHLPMVAGVIVSAVGDELTLAHPTDPTTAGAAAAILGGPALFLAGHLLFKRAVFGRFSASRLAALVALAALVPVAPVVPLIGLAGASVVVLAAVVVWDSRDGRRFAIATASLRRVAAAPAPPGQVPSVASSQTELR